jgi:hypothetical protein
MWEIQILTAEFGWLTAHGWMGEDNPNVPLILNDAIEALCRSYRICCTGRHSWIVNRDVTWRMAR